MAYMGDEHDTSSIKAMQAELIIFQDRVKESAKAFVDLGNRLKGIKDVTDKIKTPMEKLANSFKMMKVPQGMQALFKGVNKLPESMKSFTGLTKQVNTSKFKKGVKAMTGLVGGIMKSSASAWAMAKLMQLMEPFLSLLELFNPIFEVLAAIFQEALMPVIIELLPYIMQATMWLMENKEAIIQVINVLFPLLLVFHLLKGNFDELQIIMVPLTIVVDALTAAWNWLLETALKPAYNFLMSVFGPVWNWIVDTIFKPQVEFIKNVFGPIWVWLVENALKPFYDFVVGALMDGFRGIYDSFDVFIDWLGWLEDGFEDVIDLIEDLIGWIEDIPSLPGVGKGSSSDGGDDEDWYDPFHLFAADGGITQGTTKATIGESGAEALIPLERSNPFIDAIEDMAYAQQQTLIVLEEIKNNQPRKNKLNRRMFG